MPARFGQWHVGQAGAMLKNAPARCACCAVCARVADGRPGLEAGASGHCRQTVGMFFVWAVWVSRAREQLRGARSRSETWCRPCVHRGAERLGSE